MSAGAVGRQHTSKHDGLLDLTVFLRAPQSLLCVPVFTAVVMTPRSCFVTLGHRLVPPRGEFGTGQAECQFWLELCTAAASG